MNQSRTGFNSKIGWAQQLAELLLGDKHRARKDPTRWRRIAVLSAPVFWLTLFFLIPFVFVLKIALSHRALAMPPYQPLFQWMDGKFIELKISLANFALVINDDLYLKALLHSMWVAAIATVWALLIAYPFAYAMARAKKSIRNVLLLMVILPFWTSFLLRVYAWMGLLKNNGVINNILMSLNIIDSPIVMMHTDFAIYIGIVYSYLPFMVLPLYSALEKMDITLLEAAADLGCRPAKAFFTVTLPLSMPGVIAGSMLVFIPAIGEYVIPELLGGPNSLMIGKVLWAEFFLNRDWPVACAVAIGMLIVLMAPLMYFQRIQARHRDEAYVT